MAGFDMKHYFKIYISFYLTIVVFIFGCSDEKQTMTTYLALGDSYTIGESVSAEERYPVQLADSLATLGINIDNTRIVAKTGWTTDELAIGIEKRNIRETYDMVTLLIGVNNQYRGRDLENYRSEFESLLLTAIQFANNDPGRVIVISIPDWGVTPFAEGRNADQIAAEIDAFNEVNETVSQEYNIKYAYITDISRLAKEDRDLIADDGLHPSGKMYTAWLQKLLPLALSIFHEKNE